jgi:hypothetical protein
MESIKKDFEKASKVYRTNCDDFKYGKSCLKFGHYSFLGKGEWNSLGIDRKLTQTLQAKHRQMTREIQSKPTSTTDDVLEDNFDCGRA